MKYAEMKELVEIYLNVPKDSLDGRAFFFAVNEAKMAIGDAAGVYEEVAVTASTAYAWNTLAYDVTSIVGVLTSGGDPYQEWDTRGLRIRMKDAGAYTVVVRKMLTVHDMGTLSTEGNINTALAAATNIHYLFEKAIITYLYAFFKLTDDDASSDGQELRKKFYEEVAYGKQIMDNVRKVR